MLYKLIPWRLVIIAAAVLVALDGLGLVLLSDIIAEVSVLVSDWVGGFLDWLVAAIEERLNPL